MTKELFTARDIAEMLDPPVHPETVLVANRLNALPTPVVIGGTNVWRSEDLPAVREAMKRRAARRCNRRISIPNEQPTVAAQAM